MVSCGKILPAPVEIVCLLRAELAARTTQKQQPANFHSAGSIFQIGLCFNY